MNRKATVRLLNIKFDCEHNVFGGSTTKELQVTAIVNVDGKQRVEGVYHLSPSFYDFIDIRKEIAKAHACELVDNFGKEKAIK